jgi:hypothetical protein
MQKNKTEKQTDLHSEKKRIFFRPVLTFIALTISVLFILLGIFRSETETVFIKAIRICTECIGLG